MVNSRVYSNDAVFAAFPLGGIGTGTISIGSRGDLKDFEIFNHPDKGCKMPFSFFAIRSEIDGRIDARALESKIQPDFHQGRGYHPNRVVGLPHFEKSALSVKYPFADIAFEDNTFALSVSLTAFTPFIPLNADDSGIPAALFRYRVRNNTGKTAKVCIAATMPNMHGFNGFDCFDNYLLQPGVKNVRREENRLIGIFMDGDAVPNGHIRYANNAIMAESQPGLSAKTEWRKTGWWDGLYEFWSDFTENGVLHEAKAGTQENKIAPKGYVVGSLALEKYIEPGSEATFEFVLSWYVPNRVKGWPPYENNEQEPTVQNYYATRFTDSWNAGAYLLENLGRLESQSRLFTDALYASTLPEAVVDACASNLAALRSTTCFRIEDGTFAAWEGSHEHVGSCMGTCTHVWNYAQSVAFLFPELEMSARRNEFLKETDADGKMAFRTNRLFDRPAFDMLAAADGQLGTIVRAFREWSLSGDDKFIRDIWPKMKLALDYTQKEWDLDNDGLLESRQHNTYDIEFYGVNPLTGVLYLAALAAMEKIATEMGEPVLAQTYRARREASAAKLDKLTYNGEYYIQPGDDIDAHVYQHGKGCLSDQLLGQTFAYITGLGDLLPSEHIKSAANAIFQHNYKTGKERGACLQRLYVADDEDGLVLASWPDGGEPKYPFVYADEVWTGIEYAAATLLVYAGHVNEAIKIVQTVRDRQDGYRRNPWDEMECGFHYARSLASWGTLIALSGAQYNAKTGEQSFQPAIRQPHFKCFFSNGKHWGMLHEDHGIKRVEILY